MTHQGAIRCIVGTKLPYVYESSRELIVKIKHSLNARMGKPLDRLSNNIYFRFSGKTPFNYHSFASLAFSK